MFRPAETQEVLIVPLKKEEEVERKETKEEKKKSSFSDSPQTLPPLPAALERNIKIVKKVRWGGLMMSKIELYALVHTRTHTHSHY